MPEKTKQAKNKEKKREKYEDKKPKTGDESSWSKDQKTHGYYYDDACGYEIYQPDDEKGKSK